MEDSEVNEFWGSLFPNEPIKRESIGYAIYKNGNQVFTSNPIKAGDRVKRKKDNGSSKNEGQVISINNHNKAVVKWDEKASNGQQHSTLDIKVLRHV